jgi:hypothetical protein
MLFRFFLISSDEVCIQPDHVCGGRGVSGRVPYYFSRGVGSRHDSHKERLIPTPCCVFRVLPGGGLVKEFFFPGGWTGTPECPTFALQHSPTLTPAIKLPRARVVDTREPGRSLLLDVHSKAHR